MASRAPPPAQQGQQQPQQQKQYQYQYQYQYQHPPVQQYPQSPTAAPYVNAAPGMNPAAAHAGHLHPSGHTGEGVRSPNDSYFPSHVHQPQPQHPSLPHAAVANQDETASNTVANAQLGSPYSENTIRQPKFTEEWDASVRGSSIIDAPITSRAAMQRSNSAASHREGMSVGGGGDDITTGTGVSLSRGNTLKKKGSLRRGASLKRSGSRRSMKAGSVRSLALQSSHDSEEMMSAFYCPVPTTGNPTEALANRFQAWRKILKDLITYFREIQSHYEHKSKSLVKLANVVNNTSTPPGFLASGGLDDALQILRNYHRLAIVEANKAKEIEEDVILALTGLRSDLNQKMKEIKSLSGDFKNTVEKEMENTRRAVNALQECLGQTDLDASLTTGKQDPYLLRLAVDRQVERQLDEENYLHQAYLNLESSGRELESIVVGEIQKSYNAYAGILKREADAAYSAIEELRVGPIAMPKAHEWNAFIHRDNQFVDPDMPMRAPEHIHYPGRDHYASQEIRAGLLERKSKYLKSYTAGWYVLSPTHLHEFKSADKTGQPAMSLFLPEQKLGSHSVEGGSSNKFVLKGRQTGAMHRGHTWVFRAESHDTMMAWYEDIKALTEKTPEERSTFVKGHSRTLSRSSQRSVSSDGMVDDEDEEPFVSNEHAAAVVTPPGTRHDSISNRPQPGGRFPSDLQVNAERGLQVVRSPSSTSSGFVNNEYALQGAYANGHSANDNEAMAPAANAMAGTHGGNGHYTGRLSPQMVGQGYGNTASLNMDTASSNAAMVHHDARAEGVNPYSGVPAGPPQDHAYRPSHPPVMATANLMRDAPLPPQQPMGQDAGAGPMGVYDGGERPAYASAGAGYAPQPGSQAAMTGHSGGNGVAKGPTNGAATQAPAGDARPGFQGRTDSTPHIPGEYPRNSMASTSIASTRSNVY